jgi:hypothetical protein
LQQFCKLLKILAKYRAALAWRTVPPDNDGAVVSLLEDGIGPLYLHYIDDQRARLDSLGRHDLAEVFGKWQVYRMAAPAPATVSAVATAAAASAVAQGAALPSPPPLCAAAEGPRTENVAARNPSPASSILTAVSQ